MADQIYNASPADAATKYSLSKRGAENIRFGGHWSPIEKALDNVWDENRNPDGVYV
jgi:hypothetical protein